MLKRDDWVADTGCIGRSAVGCEGISQATIRLARETRQLPKFGVASMQFDSTYHPPRGWLHAGKYLLPIGARTTDWLPRAAPCAQVPIAELAVDHPASVRYRSLDDGETVSEFAFPCHADGKCETRSLPEQDFPSAFVAEIDAGMVFGRQCSVIGPARKAVRETGFYLDGAVQTSKVPVSRLRLRYWRKRWTSDVTARLWLPPAQRVAGRVAVLNARYSHNYFHWLIEILPRLAPLRRAGLVADYYLVDCLSAFQKSVLGALGIHERQLIQPHGKLLLAADEVIVPSFPSPSCLREFASRLLSGLGADGPVTRLRRIFISRRKTGTRTLADEAAVERLLHAYGFETHFMEDYPLARQARLVHEAELVVATHGAGLANLIFARPGTQVIELVPAERFNYACYPKRTRFFQLDHQIVFARCPGRRQVLQVALPDVSAALERAEEAINQRAAA